MNTNVVDAAKPAAFFGSGNSTLRKGAAFAACLAAIVYLWTWNYNKLGSFYDYSTLTDAAGKLAAGLHPFRDYSSPVQSFSIWLAYACELVFGHRYLALSYGNLALTFALFFVIVHYAKKTFPFPLALLVALAVCVASSLQHAIIWYDSLGLAFVSAISLKCAAMLRARKIRARDAIVLGALLLPASMTKMNFFAISVGVVIYFSILGVYTDKGPRNGKKIAGLAAIGAAICAAPPFVESFANHVAVSTWFHEVIRKPSAERLGDLRFLINPAFYIMEINAWWPGTVLKCAVLICLVAYLSVASASLKPETDGAGGRRDLEGRILRLATIAVFWGGTMLLVVTNIDIESSSLSLCLVGLAAMSTSGQFSGDRVQKRLRSAATVLVLYFLVVGCVSMARHARVSNALNTFPGTIVPKDGEPAYLRGVELSPQAIVRLARIDEVLKKHPGVPVYWGPGLELMNRIHPGVTDPAFPLWYHLYITVLPSDTPGLIEGIERSGAGLVVADKIEYDYMVVPVIPENFRKYMAETWVLEQRDDRIVVFRRSGDAQAAPANGGN